MGGRSCGGAYYAVIAADVRYDPELRPNAKLLYGELTALCSQDGYCWATNDYFAKLYGLSPATVSRLISQLEKRGYIRCESAATGTGSERRIYAGIFQVRPVNRGLDKNVNPPLDEKSKGGLDENVNPQEENNIYITPYSPPEGDAHPKRRPAPSSPEPDWMLFDRFWAAYPRKQNKERARRAWRRLNPDLALCRVMAKALELDKRSRQWRKDNGEYIPYPSSWLNGRMWENEHNQPEAAPENSGWAPDPEVM